jgi:hypothetical protein
MTDMVRAKGRGPHLLVVLHLAGAIPDCDVRRLPCKAVRRYSALLVLRIDRIASHCSAFEGHR